ncbi:MAG: hypothetical protein FJZ92_01735 [Chloroflexi bacterium]|nr:hypothetical protein [Chloroflexota bacterium]
MSSRRAGVGLARFGVALLFLVGAALTLRAALRRLFVALAAWLAAGALFMTGLALLFAGAWRLARGWLQRRTPPA